MKRQRGGGIAFAIIIATLLVSLCALVFSLQTAFILLCILVFLFLVTATFR